MTENKDTGMFTIHGLILIREAFEPRSSNTILCQINLPHRDEIFTTSWGVIAVFCL